MYVSTQKRGRRLGRRLGQLPGIDLATTLATSSYAPSLNCANISWLDFFLDQQAWAECQQGLETAQIESVPINVPAAGYSPAVVDAAQAAANAQIASVPSDIANVAATYQAGTPVTVSSIPWYIWAALGLGVVVVVRAVAK